MTIINQMAKSLFVRRGQFGSPEVGEDPNSFHIYEPGSKWLDEFNTWNNLSDQDKEIWVSDATAWMTALQEKSPTTYSYIMSHYKTETPTANNLDSL